MSLAPFPSWKPRGPAGAERFRRRQILHLLDLSGGEPCRVLGFYFLCFPRTQVTVNCTPSPASLRWQPFTHTPPLASSPYRMQRRRPRSPGRTAEQDRTGGASDEVGYGQVGRLQLFLPLPMTLACSPGMRPGKA